jgi:isopenicillin N synthase-like dioxygenase
VSFENEPQKRSKLSTQFLSLSLLEQYSKESHTSQLLTPNLRRKYPDMANYQSIPVTKSNLNWASLVTLDLSEFDRVGGKEKLASQLKQAIHDIGFFYIINHGINQKDIDTQFDQAEEIFSLPLEEKLPYAVNLELPGGPLGYKPHGQRTVELYDDPKYNDLFRNRGRPEPCMKLREQNEKICRHIHYHILYRLLVLVGIIMELDDEEILWKIHDYEKLNNCHMRYMCHWPPNQDQLDKEIKEDQIIAGHTDFGSFTFLFRQPIAGLQVRLDDEKEWRWVKPVDGSITVNVAVRKFLEPLLHANYLIGYVELSHWRIPQK